MSTKLYSSLPFIIAQSENVLSEPTFDTPNTILHCFIMSIPKRKKKKNLNRFSVRNVLETSISCTVHQQVYKSQLSRKNNPLPTLFLQLLFYFIFSCFSNFRLQVCLICINASNSKEYFHTVIQQLGERDPKPKCQ